MKYYTIEVEATNFCNAACVFCANKGITRDRGYMNVDKFNDFLMRQGKMKKNNFFWKIDNFKYPKINFCGLGDPLLHPEIEKLISCAKNNGFYTQLVTNGRLLTEKKLIELIDAGLDEIAISLHSVNSDNYHAITGLDVENILSNILACRNLIESSQLEIAFWRIHHIGDEFRDTEFDEECYARFVKNLNLSKLKILGPSEPWNRGGVIKTSQCDVVNDYPYWCNKIVFTFNVDWQGNIILCCNDYNYETVDLGNAFEPDFSVEEYIKIKDEIISKKNIPMICKTCRRWSDTEFEEITRKYNIDKNIIKEMENSNGKD